MQKKAPKFKIRQSQNQGNTLPHRLATQSFEMAED